MAKKPTNHGNEWTTADVKQLRTLADQNTPTRVIGIKMGRTLGSIYTRASEEDIPLKPTNQSPYNRQPK